MAYPSVLSTYTDPVPTDRLSTTPHSAIETAQNTGLKEIQAFVGTESSLIGTLMYDIRGSGSNGGGHVQTANKGGTGQTAYTKGDILVATSASVLAKLAIGTDTQVLTANSSVAAGVQWGAPTAAFTNRIDSSSSVTSFGASVAAGFEASVFSVTIPGSVLGSSNIVKGTVFVNDLKTNLGSASVILAFQYGSNSFASVAFRGVAAAGQLPGKIEYYLTGASSSVVQRANIYISLQENAQNVSSILNSVSFYETGTSSINSSADTKMGITVRFQDNSPSNFLKSDGYIIEKIA